MNPQERAFGSERIRNARRAALMRVAIVGAFLTNILVRVLIARAEPFSAATGLFPAYFLGAVALLILTLRSERAALLSWFMIPLLDMPSWSSPR